MSKERLKEVVIDFDIYHKEMNELELFKTLAMKLKFNEITLQQFKEKLDEENKKYKWWL